MKTISFPQLWLTILLRVRRINYANTMIGVLSIISISTFLGVSLLGKDLDRQRSVFSRMARTPQIAPLPTSSASVINANKNLAAFYGTLGDARYVEEQFKTLLALATKNGLQISTADYALTQDKEGSFAKYQIIFPLKGSYRSIRAFCDRMLVAIPFASLDEVTFKREAIASPVTEAKIRLTLYLTEKSMTDQSLGAL